MDPDDEIVTWVTDDFGYEDVEITLNPPPFNASPHEINMPASVLSDPPAQMPEQFAQPTYEAGRGLYIAFDNEGTGAYVCIANNLSHLLDGWRLK